MCGVGTGLGTLRCRRAPHGRDAAGTRPDRPAFPLIAFCSARDIKKLCKESSNTDVGYSDLPFFSVGSIEHNYYLLT